MKRWEAVLYGMLGALLVAILAPLAVEALQTYVRPTSGTDHPTEHLTNIDNRDEALRSNFSGLIAPTSPTPVEGQTWYQTDTDIWHLYYNGTAWYDVVLTQLAQTFVANQTISHAVTPSWVVTDTTNGVSGRLQANDTGLQVGTSVNYSACVMTNGNCRGTWDTAGNLTNTAEIRTTNGDDHTATAACASGYTRVGLWCYDTDGVLSTVRGTISTPDSNYATTVVGTGYKAAIIQTSSFILQDGTGETADLVTCTQPGDSANTSCLASTRAGAVASAALASERTTAIESVTIRLDSSGQVATKCALLAGTVSTTQCTWSLVAYLD